MKWYNSIVIFKSNALVYRFISSEVLQGKMVPCWVKCLLYKHKNLSVDPQHPHKNQAKQNIPLTPAFRYRKIPGACSLANIANKWASHSERDPVSKKKVENDRKWHPALTSVLNMQMHGYIYQHAHIHRERNLGVGALLPLCGSQNGTQFFRCTGKLSHLNSSNYHNFKKHNFLINTAQLPYIF